ncbi:MAG: carbohydrate ABC transporter permease [Clostridia bacterium]|nr:carbohydrate ABC transporter permease [Clostridia bacterium]
MNANQNPIQNIPPKEVHLVHKKKNSVPHILLRGILFLLLVTIAVAFLLPIVLTIANSFMASSEISANYGQIFSGVSGTRTFIAEKVNLKFIPDQVSFSQYITVLFKSPDYLLKFWNSVILVAPIVVFQVIVALGASYCFARFQTKFRSIVFFVYIILMLMPYQVTLVPNYLVAEKLNLLDTRWAIILPGIFSPFAVFILTKFMRRIPSAMIEAAKLDGAGEWQIFTKVCVPVCRSIIWSVVVLIFMDYWNMVEQPLVLFKERAAELSPLSVFLSKINTGDVGLAFAVATIYMVPALLLFMYSEEYLIDGIASQSGIKG